MEVRVQPNPAGLSWLVVPSWVRGNHDDHVCARGKWGEVVDCIEFQSRAGGALPAQPDAGVARGSPRIDPSLRT